MSSTTQVKAKHLSFKRLRLASSIAQYGSITKAAETQFISQSAASKSLTALETYLGVRLFDRSTLGLVLTPAGIIFLARIREVEALFVEPLQTPDFARTPHTIMSLSRQRLIVLLSLHELRNYMLTANKLNLTRAAIYNSIAHIEKHLDRKLFERIGKQLVPADLCDHLVALLKLAYSLLAQGIDEVASLEGATLGKVIIGTLPYTRTLIVPLAIQDLLTRHPRIQISTREGPYEALHAGLLAGELDMIVGATREHKQSPTLRIEKLLEDELAIIARKNHPLASDKSVTPHDLEKFGMILPPLTTPARKLFEQFMAKHQIDRQTPIVETSSLSIIRGLLLHSNKLALLSSHQISIDAQAGLLTTIPIKLEETKRPIGVTTRVNTTSSHAASYFLGSLTKIVDELTS